MNIKIISMFFAFLPMCILSMGERDSTRITNGDCVYVLKTLLNEQIDPSDVSLHQTCQKIGTWLQERDVKDDAGAVGYGRAHITFGEKVNEFNDAMSTLFLKNEEDAGVEEDKQFQALIFPTSGIDVFMERLAFLARMMKKGVDAKRIIALVGNHPHREDLQKKDYLLALPKLFAQDVSLENFNEAVMEKYLLEALQKESWNHRDAMEVAWKLVSCDERMYDAYKKFEYFDGNDGAVHRTEELLQLLPTSGLSNPIDAENTVGFIINAQGAAKLQEMLNNKFPDQSSIDVLVARRVEGDMEETLYQDVPEQRAMVKLFQFYRTLEAMVN